MPRSLLLLLGLAGLSSPAIAAEPFAFKDGDRVVMIGGAFIEREAESGYIETLLTILNPDKNITFRNLGWSGDTVTGIARARFGTPEDGFQHLKSHVLALKPTVILVSYGMTESFEGEAGLPEFEKGLNRLLDTLAETKARIVMISPTRHETKAPPLPDPKGHNGSLERYVRLLGEASAKRGYPFVDLFHMDLSKDPEPLTEEGIVPTAYGYRTFAYAIASSLIPTASYPSWGFQADATWAIKPFQPIGDPKRDPGLPRVAKVEPIANGVRFEATAPRLSELVLMGDVDASWSPCHLELPPGRYSLKIDGQPASFRASDVGRGSFLFTPPDLDRVEPLRRAIVAKNRLYFHRWRPQNETYLFGFRKHEQGQNAREIPLFDPLVDEKEKEIARLKVPVAHAYEVIRKPDPGK